MKMELLKSNGQVFLIEGNMVRDPNGSTYTTTGNSCSCFVAHCQKLLCRHMFSFRAQNNLALFALADVPQQHRLDNYVKRTMSSSGPIPFSVSIQSGKERILSKNEKFRKAQDFLNQLADTLSNLGQNEFVLHMDMFSGILNAVKQRKEIVWFTTNSDGQIDHVVNPLPTLTPDASDDVPEPGSEQSRPTVETYTEPYLQRDPTGW